MKWLLLFLCVCVIAPGCENRKREQQLDVREAELNQREQELLARENSIQLREEELAKKQQLLDSSARSTTDTLSALHPNVPGTYNTTMRCTQTTCPGSAVGDTKTETWEISFQDNSVIIKAMSDNKLVRVYSGTYIGNAFDLVAQQDAQNPTPEVKMMVRLQSNKNNELTGRREIIREKDCRIIYDLELKKQ